MIPEFTLRNGIKIPALGLGCFLTKDGEEAKQAILDAVSVGYRKIDTAMIYMNEEGVGRGVRECDIPREEVFLSTKLWNDSHGYDNTMRAFDASLKRLGLDYVDQYLMHWPGFEEESYLATWKAFETLYKEKRVRSIGVCNFLKPLLKNLMDHAEIQPMVNQLEVHPMFQPNDLIKFCQANEVQVEAWRPIVWGKLDDKEAVTEAAAKHGKTPVQIVLRWHYQRGICPLPKTVHKERMKENIDVYDFELSQEEMEAINALQTYRRTGESPDEFFDTSGWD